MCALHCAMSILANLPEDKRKLTVLPLTQENHIQYDLLLS